MSTSTPAATTTATATAKQCPLCGAAGTKVCSGCKKIGYCSKEHQREDWPRHKQTCEQMHKQTSAANNKAADVSVSWADQQLINSFSRIHSKHSSIVDTLANLQSKLENYKDATEEVEGLLDDDYCKYKIGEVFFDVTNEDAETSVNNERNTCEEEIRQKTKDKLELETEMNRLKTILYGKFGKAINLENSDQTINE
jgi:prefoldin subunit 4